MVTQIDLPDGHAVLVDEVDSDLAEYAWHMTVKGYAACSGSSPLPYRRMHRIIMERMIGRPLSRHELVDHANTNRLDNRRENLRLATNAENQFNRGRNANNTTGFKGVYANPGSSVRPFVAKIMVNRQSRYLGSFSTDTEAARAYDQAAQELAGQFARGNFT